MMDKLFGKTVDILSASLDYRAARQNVISANIANIDTPGYRPKDISFRDVMAEKMGNTTSGLAATDAKHISIAPAAQGASGYEVETTGDIVNLDTEMARLAENNLRYNLSAELLARKLRGVKNVLKEAK